MLRLPLGYLLHRNTFLRERRLFGKRLGGTIWGGQRNLDRQLSGNFRTRFRPARIKGLYLS